ncbi:MAG: trypsin-like peptidase domain-containing protein, partial [Planctomycetota bacterium]
MRDSLLLRTFAVWLFTVLSLPLVAEETEAGPRASTPTTEDLVKRVRESVVVIKSSDRAGEQRGLGSGFIVDSSGVVVTNAHVLGRGRPFVVELASGETKRAVTMLAVDESRDIAIFRIEAENLKALELGKSKEVRAGQAVAAVGNPLGFEFSAAKGIVSSVDREVLGHSMIQIAMTIEPGSSGSPVVDLSGKVLGVIAVKSGAALGFAVPVDVVSELLKSPQPVPMERWLTIGALDPGEWRAVMGGQWRQRAGRLIASGTGDGFGGRMLCLWEGKPPKASFEVEVEVKLEDEAGAAGLVFHSDGSFHHYGFYPTAGSMRLTRFEGPNVFQWSILRTYKVASYRPGTWNRIRVRVEGPKLSTYVNDELSLELEDHGLSSGKVGLCKFRAPGAEFRRFRVGKRLEVRSKVSAEQMAAIERLVEDLGSTGTGSKGAVDEKVLKVFDEIGPDSVAVLEEQARKLAARAEALKKLAQRVHERGVQTQIREALQDPKGADLFRAVL